MKMKKITAILLAIMMGLSITACAGGKETTGNNGSDGVAQNITEESQTSDSFGVSSKTGEEIGQPDDASNAGSDDSASEPDNGTEGSKILVAYFSATNNTEGVAQKLADGLGADIYEITPEQPYTEEDLDYNDSGSRSSVEMNDPDSRPAISGSVENMEQYDVVLIGYPIWWGEAPRIMSTFMESYDFSGKTLAAFCTSASSGFGSSDSALREAAGNAKWLDGQRFSAGASAEDVMEWADGLGIN